MNRFSGTPHRRKSTASPKRMAAENSARISEEITVGNASVRRPKVHPPNNSSISVTESGAKQRTFCAMCCR